MAKRNAEKELTDRNWDQEDDAEEVGTFSVASAEVLKGRVIKKAKRRSSTLEPDGGAGAFRGFGGLVAPPGGAANGGVTPTPAPAPAEKSGSLGPDARQDRPPPPSPAYPRQLAALNRAVRDWITRHVDANPLCDLTPVFRDYERHLAAIERLLPGGPDPAPAPGPPGPPLCFPSSEARGPEGGAEEAAPEEAATESKGAQAEESEEPPKAEVTEVKEEDAFYSKKCKLFYKKDNEFKEKGVGTLHLKPTANQKTQLLVRADTNLGNILLNVLVPPNMPCSRTGKNNVLIVCIPNPPISEKSATVPVTMLIRVKTAEDADELHKILLEKKEA